MTPLKAFSVMALLIIALSASVLLIYLRSELDDVDPLKPTLETLRKIDDFPVYEMEYKGGYRFDEYLEKGGRWPDLRLTPSCTCFAALSDEPIFGRNFDYPLNPILVLHTAPPGRYASISLVDLGYFGFDMQHPPDSGDLSELIGTPYLPFDGMNEMGVFVAMMAVPYAEGSKDAGKRTIGEIETIRLVLDYASSLDEALTLIEEYNIEFTDPPIHYIIADKSGRSAIVEFLGGEMRVIRNTEPWQVSTNFIVTGSGAPTQAPCWRYRAVYDGLKEKRGSLTNDEAMSLLQRSSQENTFWSAVYDPETLEVTLAVGRDYGNIMRFKLRP